MDRALRFHATPAAAQAAGAAPVAVSTAFTKDPMLLARAAWQLGQRGIAIELGDTWLRYRHDHELDDLVDGLGLRIFSELAQFRPESPA